jgi:hypothetical protein
MDLSGIVSQRRTSVLNWCAETAACIVYPGSTATNTRTGLPDTCNPVSDDHTRSCGLEPALDVQKRTSRPIGARYILNLSGRGYCPRPGMCRGFVPPCVAAIVRRSIGRNSRSASRSVRWIIFRRLWLSSLSDGSRRRLRPDTRHNCLGRIELPTMARMYFRPLSCDGSPRIASPVNR